MRPRLIISESVTGNPWWASWFLQNRVVSGTLSFIVTEMVFFKPKGVFFSTVVSTYMLRNKGAALIRIGIALFVILVLLPPYLFFKEKA